MMVQFMTKYIPNSVTSLNLTSGFIAIILALNGNTETASWFIVAAMVFDFLDGFLARLLKAYSLIGKELDSLADVVSFGVAPAILIFRILVNQPGINGLTENGIDDIKTILLLIAPSIMVICAALRLAIFNIDTTQSTTFRGMPTPANAIAVVSLVLAGHLSESPIVNYITSSPVIVVCLTLLLSGLMVSRLPLLSLKVANLKLKGNEGRFLLIGLIIISFLLLGIGAILLIIPLYLTSSFVALLFQQKTA
jgi:CDP-diacylglycerol---serine O-phosphatidyltransferase